MAKCTANWGPVAAFLHLQIKLYVSNSSLSDLKDFTIPLGKYHENHKHSKILMFLHLPPLDNHQCNSTLDCDCLPIFETQLISTSSKLQTPNFSSTTLSLDPHLVCWDYPMPLTYNLCLIHHLSFEVLSDGNTERLQICRLGWGEDDPVVQKLCQLQTPIKIQNLVQDWDPQGAGCQLTPDLKGLLSQSG